MFKKLKIEMKSFFLAIQLIITREYNARIKKKGINPLGEAFKEYLFKVINEGYKPVSMQETSFEEKFNPEKKNESERVNLALVWLKELMKYKPTREIKHGKN